MRIEKSSLPKGMSSALKSSVLVRALSEAGIELDTELIHGSGGIFFDAHFWPPNQNVSYERLYVRAGAVQASASREARAYIEDSVVPEFVAWVKNILALPSNSPVRREQQYFVREMPND
jgi:hypothetical protein